MNYNIKQKVKNASMVIVLLSMVLQVFVPFLNVYADEADSVKCIAMQETVNGGTTGIVGSKNDNLDFSLKFALTSQNTDGNSEIIIEDEFDEAFNIKSAVVRNKAGDLLSNLNVEVNGQKVKLKLKPEDKNTWLDRELEIVVKANLSNHAQLDETYKNNFNIIMDGKRYKSNDVKAGYVEKLDLGVVNKKVKEIKKEGSVINYQADFTLPTEIELKEKNTEINKIRVTDEYVIKTEAAYDYDNVKIMMDDEDVTESIIVSTAEDRLLFDLPRVVINDNLGKTLHVNYDLVLKEKYDVSNAIYNESTLTSESSIVKDILFEAGYYDTKGNLSIQVDNEIKLDVYYQDETGLDSIRLNSEATAIIDDNYDRMINIPVEKIWRDEAEIADKLKEEMPSITINLNNEDELLSTVTLNENNNWKAEFENIPLSKITELIVSEEVDNEYIYSYVKGNYINGYSVENVWRSPDLEVVKYAIGLIENMPLSEITELTASEEVDNEYVKGNYINEHSVLDIKEIYYVVEFDVPENFEPFELDELTLVDTVENDLFEIDLNTVKFKKGTEELNDFDYTTEIENNSVIFKIDEKMVEEHKGTKLTLEYTVEVFGALYTNIIVNEVDLVLSVKGVGGNSNRSYHYTNVLDYGQEPDLKKYDIDVTKEWVGEPVDEVTLELIGNDDNVISSITLTEADDWKGQFKDVEILDSAKENIEVREVGLEDKYEVEVTGNVDEGFTLTNTELFEPGRLMNIFVQKEWIGLSENSVTINLYANNEKIDSVVLSENNDWEHTFTNLPDINKYGEEIEYTIDEEAISGYKVQINGNVEEGFIIKNTRFADTDLPVICEYELVKEEELVTKVTAKKVWLDAPKVKPTVELQLYRNGIRFENTVKLKNGQTEYTWENLLKVDENGQEYEYTVDEVEVPKNYEKTFSRDGFTITNRYIDPNEAVINVTGTKVWENAPRIKPTIELQLYRNGIRYGEAVELKNGDTQYTWKDLLEKDKQGVKYEYTINEVKTPENYTKTISKDGLTITNKYEKPIEERMNVTGTKVWENAPRIKPTIELQLYRNGIRYGEAVELKNGDTQYTWKDLLEKDKQGVKYEYTINEVKTPENYTKTISKDGLTITNKYEKPIEERMNVTGTKVWENSPGIKPTIELQLYRNGIRHGEAVELRNGETQYTWKGLLKKDKQGVKYEYTINEVKTPENYTKTISKDGLTITNKYEKPIEERMNVTGNKIWENAPEVKPTIELQLYRNGEVLGEPVELKNGDTEYTWYNLLEMDENGKYYKYTIDEVEVPEDYEKTISSEGLSITNKYTGIEEVDLDMMTEVKIEKVWDGEKQESATIHLLASGEIIESVKLSDENDWEFIFKDLPVYDENGNEIEYTVEEEAMENYEAEINGNPKDGFLIINRPIDKNAVDDVQTYDGGVLSVVAVLVLSMVAFVITSKQKNK